MHIIWYACISIVIIASVLVGRIIEVNSEYFYLASVAILPCLFWARNERKLFTVITITIISAFLIARTSQTVPSASFDPTAYSQSRHTFKGKVVSAPRLTTKSTQAILGEVTVKGSSDPNGQAWFGQLAVTLPRYADIRYGDIIQATAQLQPLSEVKDEGYRQYLKNHNIYGTLVWPEITVLSRGNGSPLVAMGIKVQELLNEQYQKILPKDAAAFLSGVVLGSKQELSEDFEQALKTTGTTHIIVASGYNISVLITILIIMFGQLRRITQGLIVITMLVCFVLVSGLDASIIRASIMATLGILATAFGRQHHALYCLLITAFLMLIVHPLWLLDTGFQLSFLATTGIILFQASIIEHLESLPRWMSDSVSTTIAAQVLVLPVLIVTFGKISIISILTNILVLWITPWLMFSGIVLAGIMLLSHTLGKMMVIAIYPMFWYIKKVIMLTSTIPFASIPLKLTWISALAYYLIIFAAQWRGARQGEA